LILPTDIRVLVEETYHPSSRAQLLALGGERLLGAEQKRELELTGKRVKAQRCCIPPTDASPEGQPSLSDDDDEVQAFTRDGTSATILPFWWDGEYGRALDADEDAPYWNLDSDASDAWRLAGELSDQTLSIPARCEHRCGPVPAADSWQRWSRQFTRFADDAGLRHRTKSLPMKRDNGVHKGWLRMDGRLRRVLYTNELGLFMPKEKDGEKER